MMSASSLLTIVGEAGLRSLLLAGVVGVGLFALRIRNVVAQKSAWILVLVASLFMPWAARWFVHTLWLPQRAVSVLSPQQWPSPLRHQDASPAIAATRPTFAQPRHEGTAQTRHAVSADDLPAVAVDVPAVAHFPAPAISNVPTELRASQPAAPRLRHLDAASLAVWLFLAVCGALLARLLYGLWVAMRLWSSAEPARLPSHFDAGGLRVRATGQISSPLTVGSGIVLPADYELWDSEKLRIVLAHEASHVRQGDFYLQLCASLYTAMFWFSPLGWWLKRKLGDLAETISDRAAVGHAASNASYAQVLLEFAALPRPIPIGVAMANQGRLIPRIERLLNESSFRQAFAGGRARIATAVLLVPAALFAATALVRVHAAAQQTPPATAPASQPAQNDIAPAAHPVNPPQEMTPPPDQIPQPSPQAAPAVPPAPGPGNAPSAAPVPDGPPSAATAPEPPDSDNVLIGPRGTLWIARTAQLNARLSAQQARMLAQVGRARNMAVFGKGVGNVWWGDGNSYAYVTGEGEKNIHFSGNWYDGSREEIDKARKVAHGDFLWFERDGKFYVIDDPAVLAPLKPMQDQMEALGHQQEELGRQQEELGRKQEELGRQQEQLRVPTPDMKKELDKLQAIQSKLAALQGKDASQEQLAEIQGELGDVQGRIGDLQGEMGSRIGDLGSKQGELGEQQGKLGAQQGRLGAQQGRIAREMDGKVLTIIDECLKDGKARPVQ